MNNILDLKYSVLMSVYIKEKPEYLEASILSMLNQTYKPSEFVIVEDGPLTQDLENVINKYCNENKNLFKVVKLEKNMGLGPALRRGVEECSYDWIARIDSDDISVPERCEKQFNRIKENPKIDLIGSNHIEFIDDIDNIQSYKNLPITNEEIQKYSRRRNPFSHSVMLLKKEKVLQAGNYREYYYLEDYDLWVRMIESGCYCENIDEYLSYVRVSKDLYKRRGGMKYLKSILKFKKELFQRGFYSLKDYLISSGTHIVVCLMPNSLRDIIYRKILRK